MSSCCGNELVFNSALHEVLSYNYNLVSNLLVFDINTCLILSSVIIASVLLLLIFRKSVWTSRSKKE